MMATLPGNYFAYKWKETKTVPYVLYSRGELPFWVDGWFWDCWKNSLASCVRLWATRCMQGGITAVCPCCTMSLVQNPLKRVTEFLMCSQFWRLCAAAHILPLLPHPFTVLLAWILHACSALYWDFTRKILSTFVSLQIAAEYLLSIGYYLISTPHIYHVINSLS